MSAADGDMSGPPAGHSGENRPMLRDMRRQAQVLNELVGRKTAFLEAGRALWPLGLGRIVAFGSGDGWFAARAAAGFARQRLGLDYRALSSLEMLAYEAPRMRPERDAAVAISMSGTADRTNEAAEAVVARGARLLALTNGGGGALAGIAQAKIGLEVADLAPFLTGTAKYVATLCGLMMLLEGAAQHHALDWTALLSELATMLKGAERFAHRIASGCVNPKPTGVRILSAGPNLATADYAMAKFIKLVDLPIWSDDVEEFAHRQFWSCPATDIVVYIAANPAVARCATSSAAALGSMGVRTVAVDMPSCPVGAAAERFTLPECEETVSPLLAAIPLQFLAYFLALELGGQPDQSQEVGDPVRFQAAQLLSRRGELASPTSP